MHPDDISSAIVGSAIAVHSTVGPGLLESAYEACLAIELASRGIRVARQVPMPVVYGNHRIDLGYRLDLVVEDRVVVELKAVTKILPVHRAQLLSYLRMGGFHVGLLLNFHAPRMVDGIVRLVN